MILTTALQFPCRKLHSIKESFENFLRRKKNDLRKDCVGVIQLAKNYIVTVVSRNLDRFAGELNFVM